MRENRVIEYPVDLTSLAKRYTEEAIKIITKNKHNPFFLSLAHAFPHIPLHASKDFYGKSARGTTIQEINLQ
jgi:arylsulfatase A